MSNENNKEILILGIVHSAQSDILLNNHIKILKNRNFSEEFIKEDKERILLLRKMMLEKIQKFNPDIIFEESGPWHDTPGDVLKKIMNGGETILENRYKDKHNFVDSKVEGDKKPPYKKREEDIYNNVRESLEENNKIALIIGSHHFENIRKIFKKQSVNIKATNLKKDFNFPS